MTEHYGNPMPASSPNPEPADTPPTAFTTGPYAPQGRMPNPYAQAPAFPAAPGSPHRIHAPGYPVDINPNDKTNGMAITALILGITGFLILPACVGLGLGFGALGTVKRTGQPGKGLAIAGIILSSAWLVFWILGIILS